MNNGRKEQVHPEIRLLLCIMDEAYEKKAWHGPNLRGSIRGLTAEQAAWKPAPNRHSVWEIVVHAAYWKYAVRRRLRGDERGSFPLKGSNWFPLPELLTQENWQMAVKLLRQEHQGLRESVAALPHEALYVTPAGSKVSNVTLIHGIAAHDLYHTGQIQLLKRLRSK
jgi:hypothetical protein